MAKISFVLPTFNRIAWFPETLQSLLEQTEKEIEIIVVDDCSTDGTKELLDSWLAKDPRVKVIHNEKNLGAGKSRNVGMELASSEIICVCDSDDVYPEDRAEITLRWFKEHPESELVTMPYIRIGYFGEHLQGFPGCDFDHEAFKKDGSVSYYSNPSTAYKKAPAMTMGGYPDRTKEKTDDIQFITNWVNSGHKIDFDDRSYACLHRVLPNSEMATLRGWQSQWVGQ